ncbi:putative transcription factor C2H2 family [Helianthus anomalus]
MNNNSSQSSQNSQKKKKMGFPVAYTDFFLPKLILHILTHLVSICNHISTSFSFTGLLQHIHRAQPEPLMQPQSFSAVLLRELFPVVKFSEIVDPPESCVVCMCEFDAGDEIRRLTNCIHVFHRGCIDQWMDYDKKTCPVCRMLFVPDDLQDSFNERLWAASGIADYYGDSSLVGSL